jgi:hypothetical protein
VLEAAESNSEAECSCVRASVPLIACRRGVARKPVHPFLLMLLDLR